ncbi:hypothetical protein ACQUEN_08685 [Lactococcus taiwanensis]|uniref:hypothetical protein n=1 Tax=Lactococcus taiwanensis TaxID=1151742 RepID=UPI003D13A1A2
MINKKKRRLKKKNLLFALFVISVLCFLVWAVVHHFQKDETSVTPASKITSKSDIKGREDYVLMDTGDVNQIKIGAYQGCEIVSLYNALVYLGQTHGKSAEDLIDELTLVGWGEILTVVMLEIRGLPITRFQMVVFLRFGLQL